MAYLADVFGHLSAFDIKIQKRIETLLSVSDKLQLFQLHLELWRNKFLEGLLQIFPLSAAAIVGAEQVRALKNYLQLFGYPSTKASVFLSHFNISQYDRARNPLN